MTQPIKRSHKSLEDFVQTLLTEAKHQIGYEMGEDEARKHGYPYDRPGRDPDPTEIVRLCTELLGRLYGDSGNW